MADSGKKLDEIAGDFGSKVAKLKGLFSKEEKFWGDIKKLKSDRDKLNVRVKELSSKGKKLRDERDKMNEKVASLKKKRSELIDKIKSMRGDAKAIAGEKRSLSKDAGEPSVKIISRLNKNLNKLLSEDMPLEKEKKLFEDTVSLSEKLNIAIKADEVHDSMLSKYREILLIENEINALSESIRGTAKEAEEKHLESVKVYAELDEVRKQSDDFHKKLLVKYDEIKPVRDEITSLKSEIKSTEDEMEDTYNTIAKARETTLVKKRAEKISEANEKLKTGKRISFDDFKAVIESGGSLPEQN